MKLIIDIPENPTNGDVVTALLKLLASDESLFCDRIISLDIDHRLCIEASDRWWRTSIVNGTTLDSVIEDIKAEIKEWYWQADKQALAKDPCVVDAMVDLFIRTLDNRISRKGEENE